MKQPRIRHLLTICIAALCCTGPAHSAAIDQRLESVAKLLEQSSAGRLFAEVELQEACAQRARARELLAEARRLHESGGNEQTVNELLDEATREMLAAVRLVKQEASTRDAAEQEFRKLSTSLDALLDAYLRIQAESSASSNGDELALLVNESRDQAVDLRDGGNTAAGLEVLKGAYATVQTAIGEIRGGETLIRTLHFETPEDEYAYELDRNDSLRMLVEVLLSERMADNGRLAEQVDRQVEAAASLRQEGEALAGASRFDEAIATLEASTLQLVQAIRRAGIFIPQ